MKVYIDYYRDEETARWHYIVPSLHIVGGSATTRAEAEQQAREAIIFTLDEPIAAAPEHEVGTLTLQFTA